MMSSMPDEKSLSQPERKRSLLITIAVSLLLLAIACAPLLFKISSTFAASAPTTQTMLVAGHKLTIQAQQIHGMKKVHVIDAGTNQGQRVQRLVQGGVFDFAYDAGAHMLYSSEQFQGSGSVNFAVKLDPTSLTQRQATMQQIQTLQVQQVQNLDTSVAFAQGTGTPVNTVSGSDLFLGDGFSFITKDVTNKKQNPGFPWQIHLGSAQLSSVEGGQAAGDLRTFQGTIDDLKNKIVGATTALGGAVTSTVLTIVTSATGVGAVVGALLAAGFLFTAIGQIVPIFIQHQVLKDTFHRLQAEAIPVPKLKTDNGITKGTGYSMGNPDMVGNNGGTILPGQQMPTQGTFLCPICG